MKTGDMKSVIKKFLVLLCSHFDGQIDGVVLVSLYFAHSSVVRASYRCLEGRGFDSFRGLDFFLSIS